MNSKKNLQMQFLSTLFSQHNAFCMSLALHCNVEFYQDQVIIIESDRLSVCSFLFSEGFKKTNNEHNTITILMIIIMTMILTLVKTMIMTMTRRGRG